MLKTSLNFEPDNYSHDIMSNAAKWQALRALGILGLGSIGIGAAGRAGIGLTDMLSQDRENTQLRKMVSALQPSTLKIPYPVYEDEDLAQAQSFPKLHPKRKEEQRLVSELSKTAQISDPVGSIPPVIGKDPGGPDRGFAGIMAGDPQTKWWAMPWAIPALTVGSGAGLVGGYKLVDWIAKKMKEKEEAEDVDVAREEYRKALLGPHFDNLKSGSESTLEKLAEEFEKSADPNETWGQWGKNLGGGSLGLYLTLAGLLAGTGAYAGYNYGIRRNPYKMMKDRVKKDLAEQWANQPPSAYASLVPIKIKKDEESDLAQANNDALSYIQQKSSEFLNTHLKVD